MRGWDIRKSEQNRKVRSIVDRQPVKKQRTSGPVNAHLTPRPGIYFNAFIDVYSPRAGADNPLRTNVDINRKPLPLCSFVASFKTISLKSDFIHVFHMYVGCPSKL